MIYASKRLKITGGRQLEGHVRIGYAKNAILPFLAAMLVTKDTVKIPLTHLIDTKAKLSLLEHMGYKINYTSNEITIIPSISINKNLPSHLVASIRSSILFLGPLLALGREVVLNFPGGDQLERTFDFHIECLKKMGALIHLEDNKIYAKLPEGQSLKAVEYTFPKSSVGATQHMLLTAILCEKGSITTLNNCAQEPECLFLVHVLKKYFKANITKMGSRFIIVGNGDRLGDGDTHHIEFLEDRIEALTYLALGLITGGKVTIEGKNLLSIMGGADLELLIKIGGTLTIENNWMTIENKSGELKAVKYTESGEFPLCSTDFMPIFCTLLGAANGTSIFTEKIHKNRFQYIEEINKFGGVFLLHNSRPNTIIIHGSDYVAVSNGICPDIRGGMALLMAALRVDGTSIISNISHIFRGYDYLLEKIISLGGKIEIIE